MPNDDEDDNVVPLMPAGADAVIVAEVGGLVDETRVTLALYGEDLDPLAITRLLGVEPTTTHRRGDVRTPGARPFPHGAWLFQLTATPPRGPEQLLAELLEQLPPSSDPMWKDLRQRFDVQLRLGVYLEGWNRGFGLASAQLQQISSMVGRVEVDIYAEGGEDD